FANPAFDERHFVRAERIAFLGHVGFGAADFFHDPAFGGITRGEGRAVFAAFEKSLIGRQVKLALQFARMMTAGAAPFEDRINVVEKTDVVGVGGLNRQTDHQAKEKSQHGHGGAYFVAAVWLQLMVNEGILIHSKLKTFWSRIFLSQASA